MLAASPGAGTLAGEKMEIGFHIKTGIDGLIDRVQRDRRFNEVLLWERRVRERHCRKFLPAF